ncbi:hypothetical protein N6H14_09130 [Paenibacillus sp. CC-CFT747]|nr:hypothetical protein N6H14_09130 [Paenibacillus sp. CC-CFT747]
MPQTLDELEAVLKAFKEKDPDGNGKDDTIPMMTDLNGIKNALMGASRSMATATGSTRRIRR